MPIPANPVISSAFQQRSKSAQNTPTNHKITIRLRGTPSNHITMGIANSFSPE